MSPTQSHNIQTAWDWDCSDKYASAHICTQDTPVCIPKGMDQQEHSVPLFARLRSLVAFSQNPTKCCLLSPLCSISHYLASCSLPTELASGLSQFSSTKRSVPTVYRDESALMRMASQENRDEYCLGVVFSSGITN